MRDDAAAAERGWKSATLVVVGFAQLSIISIKRQRTAPADRANCPKRGGRSPTRGGREGWLGGRSEASARG